MKTYQSPDNLIELLNGVLKSSLDTSFYSSKIDDLKSIESLDDFAKLPITTLDEYRAQRLVDVLADRSKVQWIVGAHRGQNAEFVAIAEGAEESVIRFDLFADCVKEQLSETNNKTCAIVTSPHRRYFAAEIATILIHAGIPTHVFIDHGTDRTYERLRIVHPDILVILSDDLNEDKLVGEIDLCVTFQQSHKLDRFPQLDVYVVDELGFLGHSIDCKSYVLNKDTYYFETSYAGTLVVTSLYNRVQPVLRVETKDKISQLIGDTLEIVKFN